MDSRDYLPPRAASLRVGRRDQRHEGSHGVALRTGPDQPHPQPVIVVGTFVQEDGGRLIDGRENQVDVAVVVDVASGDPPARWGLVR